MIDKILVALGSVASSDDRACVARSIELCGDSSSIELFAIVHEGNLDGYLGNTEIYEPLRRRLVNERADQISTLAEEVRAKGIDCTAKAVWEWPRGEAITRAALTLEVDLIVLSFGVGDERRLSSRDWRFVAECPLPILVVNGAVDKSYRRIVAAVDPVHAHAKPANLDEAIVRVAAVVRQRTEAELELVHAFVPLARYGVEFDDIELSPLTDAETLLEASRQRTLHDLASRAEVDAAATRLVEGSPDGVLEGLAARGDADLIVMGALSRGKLTDFIIGSTAERVLQHANSDVLLVKPAT